MFVWKTSVILNEIKCYLPDLHTGLMTIKEVLGKPTEAKTVEKIYKRLASISIDYGVMEKAKHVFVLPAEFGWSDVGSWDALWDISAKDPSGNASSGNGEIVLEDTENSLICGTNKLVALVGIKDVIVVDTKDAILICKRGRSQDVKKIVDRLEAKKLKKYL
jgi:mannose-1-phosphate guanylyltransferase